ncbi:hypothetical protein Tsubulata_051132 [Turnera subulata]|uniref:Cystatin domain-containing protein n=1 Tax=Turnera subulata TaxID=218843 RepID=A0A9Q0F7I5_9ROSI|nr:hypothetical protein Tsubulata_051132 [Turnera subulata]
MAAVVASAEIPQLGGKRQPHSPVDEIIPGVDGKRQKVDDVEESENVEEKEKKEIQEHLTQYRDFADISDGFIVDEDLARKIPKEKYERYPYPFPVDVVGDGHPSKARSCAIKCIEYYNNQQQGRNFQFRGFLAANVTNFFTYHYLLTVEVEDRSVTAPYPVYTFRVVAGAPTPDENSPIEPRFLVTPDDTVVYLKEPPYTVIFEDYYEEDS